MSKMKSRLGRGLSSLISVPDASAEAHHERNETIEPVEVHAESSGGPTAVLTTTVPVAAVVPNPHQPRRTFSDAGINELAASLKANGLIQPIIVRKSGDRYELVAGERRWRAARLAGFTDIPAIVREMDGLTQAQLALVENIQREDLNPIDRATGYRTLMTQLGLTQAELAGRLGEERSGIANYARLLDLHGDVQTMVAGGQISMGHGKVLAGVTDIKEQLRLAELAISQGLSVRNLERLVGDATRPAVRRTASSDGAAHIQDLERTITRQLGLKVQIRSTGKKGEGKITVHYSTLDQFDEFMARIGVDIQP